MFLFQYDHKKISLLADRLITKIMSEIPHVVMNGDPVQRYPGIVSVFSFLCYRIIVLIGVPKFSFFLKCIFIKIYQNFQSLLKCKSVQKS